MHGIVHEHGGHVLVDSPRGAGATFRVAASGRATGGERAPEPRRPPALRSAALRGRVLLVDDEEMVRGFMRELLEGWGLESVTARDPRTRGGFAREPDASISSSPTRRCRGSPAWSSRASSLALRPALPVILYSGRNDLLDSNTATAAGVRTLLAKPVDKAALRAALQDALAAKTA